MTAQGLQRELAVTAAQAVSDVLEPLCEGGLEYDAPVAQPADATLEAAALEMRAPFRADPSTGVVLALPEAAVQALTGSADTVSEAVAQAMAAIGSAVIEDFGEPLRLDAPATGPAVIDDAALTVAFRAGDAAFTLHVGSPAGSGPPAGAAVATRQDGLIASLGETVTRVSAEIGRVQLPLDQLVGMPPGAVLELDRAADDPVELFVNGRRFALGRLLVTEDGWAVRVETMVDGDR